MRQERREIGETDPFSVFFHETKCQMEHERHGTSREEGRAGEWARVGLWGGEFLGGVTFRGVLGLWIQ